MRSHVNQLSAVEGETHRLMHECAYAVDAIRSDANAARRRLGLPTRPYRSAVARLHGFRPLPTEETK